MISKCTSRKMEGLFVQTVTKSGNYKIFLRLEATDLLISNKQGRSSQILCARDPKYLNWPLPNLRKSEFAEYELDRTKGKRKKMKALVTGNWKLVYNLNDLILKTRTIFGERHYQVVTNQFYPLKQRFSNFFQVGTTFISQNVLRTTLILGLSNSLGLP